ncbi:MAG: helix-turn-helix domain-containing protein [Syntrophomonadaceae bacterium]|nr:helix-turn-helix domain-containing protein [Syntrophomonadaceae bacterium]MDD4549415.1 helix-turn-helix domain-containing protein [Syntrophomonadaceae bacterium]
MAKQETKNPMALSPAKAADKLGLSPGVVRQMIYDSKLPAVQVGRRWIIPVKALERWLDEQVQG